MNYSTTQGANYFSIAAAISIIIRVWTTRDFATLTTTEIELILVALGILVASTLSALNRYRKGDVSATGKLL